MKKILFISFNLLFIMSLFLGCGKDRNINYMLLNNYFIKNNVTVNKNPLIISSKAQFDSLFGLALTMRQDFSPMVDFQKQFIIAIVKPETNRTTKLLPLQLTKNDKLNFIYSFYQGAGQSFSTRPILLIVVDKKYEADVNFHEKIIK